MPLLQRSGHFNSDSTSSTKRSSTRPRSMFDETAFSVATPCRLDPAVPFRTFESQREYGRPDPGQRGAVTFARVKVPDSLPHWWPLLNVTAKPGNPVRNELIWSGSNGSFRAPTAVFLEQVLEAHRLQ